MENEPNEKKNDPSNSVTALFAIMAIMIFGLAGTLFYSGKAADSPQMISFMSIGLLVSGSAGVIGALLGFLFGIPKTLQGEVVEAPVNGNAAANSRTSNYRANTNLEQISDWLTKILVGVGLTQIGVLPTKLQELSTLAARGLDDTDASRTFITAVMLFFVVCGFLFGYLWTRLFLPGAFRKADLDALESRVAEQIKEVAQVNKKLSDLERQSELDATALNLAQRQFHPSRDVPPPSQEALDEALSVASSPIRVQIFSQAQKIRSENWKNNKPKMESAIPVFRALITTDEECKYHRNHAQLGYALKDQRVPDLLAALDELTKAIDIRGSWQVEGWLFYEFNRAICRIKLDENFQNRLPSEPELKDVILADLRAAATCELRVNLLRDPDVRNWMALNAITEADLDAAPV